MQGYKINNILFIELVFRTFKHEPIVFQIGSSDSVRCLKACNIIQNDINGIDLNMGWYVLYIMDIFYIFYIMIYL